jgi:hypothetical protein
MWGIRNEVDRCGLIGTGEGSGLIGTGEGLRVGAQSGLHRVCRAVCGMGRLWVRVLGQPETYAGAYWSV